MPRDDGGGDDDDAPRSRRSFLPQLYTALGFLRTGVGDGGEYTMDGIAPGYVDTHCPKPSPPPVAKPQPALAPAAGEEEEEGGHAAAAAAEGPRAPAATPAAPAALR